MLSRALFSVTTRLRMPQGDRAETAGGGRTYRLRRVASSAGRERGRGVMLATRAAAEP